MQRYASILATTFEASSGAALPTSSSGDSPAILVPIPLIAGNFSGADRGGEPTASPAWKDGDGGRKGHSVTSPPSVKETGLTLPTSASAARQRWRVVRLPTSRITAFCLESGYLCQVCRTHSPTQVIAVTRSFSSSVILHDSRTPELLASLCLCNPMLLA